MRSWRRSKGLSPDNSDPIEIERTFGQRPENQWMHRAFLLYVPEHLRDEGASELLSCTDGEISLLREREIYSRLLALDDDLFKTLLTFF